MNTFRLCHHSKNDDNRPLSEIDEWKKKDPILIREKLPSNTVNNIEQKVTKRIDSIVNELSKDS